MLKLHILSGPFFTLKMFQSKFDSIFPVNEFLFAVHWISSPDWLVYSSTVKMIGLLVEIWLKELVNGVTGQIVEIPQENIQ